MLNTAFGEPAIAVDTHIFRVANRTKLAPGKTPLVVETKLLKSVPDEYKQDAHHWLILHGRYICKARKPECWRCDIADVRIQRQDRALRTRELNPAPPKTISVKSLPFPVTLHYLSGTPLATFLVLGLTNNDTHRNTTRQ